MGTETKVIENCENIIRNRNPKKILIKTSEISAKEKIKLVEQLKHKENDDKQEEATIKESELQETSTKDTQSHEKINEKELESTTNNKSSSKFTIKVEFDLMSIALFTLAIITRFFRLSEPRNVV